MSTDKNGCTSLHKAALEGSLYVLKYLISKCDCNLMVFDNKGRTTFHCAVRHIDVLRYLIIECICDPMATDQSTDRSTILHNYVMS